MAFDPTLWKWIQTYAPRYGLDPRAVAAIAENESGGSRYALGDNGSSYGFAQLHRGGALPAAHYADARQWAASLPGVLYVLQQMGRVAKGLHGQAAISNIAQRFERPSDPQHEIQVALGYYNRRGFAPTAGGGLPPAQGAHPPTATQPAGANPLALLQSLGTLQPAQPLPQARDTLANLFAPPQPDQSQQQQPDLTPAQPRFSSQLDAIHSALLHA